MSKRKDRPGNPGATTISAWGTKFSGSFPSQVKTGNLNPSNLTTSRGIMDKQKPTSGKARLNPNGWRAPTPFRSYVCKLRPGPAFDYFATNSSGTVVRHSGERGYQPALPQMSIYCGVQGTGRFPLTSDNTVNRATTEAMNKLKDMDANLGESIATLNQTFGLFAEIAVKMLQVYKAIKARKIEEAARWDRCRNLYYSMPMAKRRRIRKREFFKHWGLPQKRPETNPLSKSAASAWLELHYGWQPLVEDIRFAAKTLQHGLPKQKVTAVRNVTEDHAFPAKTGTVAPYTLTQTGTFQSGAKVRIDCSLTHPNLATFDALGLVNPFSLGWELLPFSFVLDWLLPIGNALKGLSTPFGLNLLGISTTRWTKASIHYSWTQYPNYSRGTKISATVESMATYRTVSFFWPMPRVYYKSPFTNLSRAVTALALLQQLR